MASGRDQARPGKQRPHFDQNSCTDCSQYPLHVMRFYLNDLTVQRHVIKNDFAKAVNGFLNCSGGIIVVCVKEGQGSVDLLNQIIGSRLDEMLQDDALHSSVYSLWHHADHIVLRVNPQPAVFNDRKRMPSIYNFHTITSLIMGRGHITNVKLARLLKARNVDNSPRALSLYVFRESEVVYQMDQQQNVTNIPFVESTFVQAKKVPPEDQSSITSLSVYMWGQSKDYVTAFSKSEAGGSVFFGVKEEKKKASGKFFTEGIILKTTGDDRKELSQELCDHLKQNVLWLGPMPPQNPIDIKFHAASSPVSDKFVIEVRVNFYNGVCFIDTEGPELYDDKKRVVKDRWLKWFRNSFDIPDDMPMEFFQPEFRLEEQDSMTFAIKA